MVISIYNLNNKVIEKNEIDKISSMVEPMISYSKSNNDIEKYEFNENVLYATKSIVDK